MLQTLCEFARGHASDIVLVTGSSLIIASILVTGFVIAREQTTLAKQKSRRDKIQERLEFRARKYHDSFTHMNLAQIKSAIWESRADKNPISLDARVGMVADVNRGILERAAAANLLPPSGKPPWDDVSQRAMRGDQNAFDQLVEIGNKMAQAWVAKHNFNAARLKRRKEKIADMEARLRLLRDIAVLLQVIGLMLILVHRVSGS